LTAAALRASVNLDDAEAVGQFCNQALVYVPLDRDGGPTIEALVAVNGRCYSKAELNAIGAVTPKLAGVPQARELVNSALRLLRGWGRVVMLGRDIGARVFPETPFKFFLNAPAHVLEHRHRDTTGRPGVDDRNRADRRNTILTQGALEIDTSIIPPSAVCDTILVHLLCCANGDKEVAI
jgi:cytidylate kinase